MRELEPQNPLWEATVETARFCFFFDKIFNCLNTQNMKEAKLKRKPDLWPYFSPNDERLKVHVCIIIITYIKLIVAGK